MTPSLDESYSYAARITRARARNFYYTFLFLPPARRRSIFAVYAFSRRADDAVDDVAERGTRPEDARAGLRALEALLGREPSSDPLAPALRDTRERYAIPEEPFRELLLGMEMDLEKKVYETFEELRLYCYRVASVVGLISVEIFGHTGESVREPAEKLGIGMQLVNVIRDVAEDLDLGRSYLPREDLERFGYGADELRRRVVDDRFRALLAFEAERARGYFLEAEPLFDSILPESRYCPVLLRNFYSRILDRIEARGWNVFEGRVRLPVWEKLYLAAKLWRSAARGKRGALRPRSS